MQEVVFKLLGPLEVWAGGHSVLIGAPRQRTLLAMLLLSPDRVVSVNTLIRSVWRGKEPRTARNQVAICVAGLRQTFKESAAIDNLISTSPPGYVLARGEHRIDVLEFEDRARLARDAARAGHADRACSLVDEALSLWRGSVLEGLTGELIEAEAARLEEMRLDLMEDRAGLLLQLGRHRVLIGELTTMVKEHPLREQARAHLMLAQYRSGRRAEALEIFRAGRSQLVEALGIDPGPALQDLHDMMLRDSPELTPPPQDLTPPGATAKPAHLPASPTAFSGRADELAALDEILGDTFNPSRPAVAAISGVGGVGKTALAMHWANSVSARFPDGQLFVDLRGYDRLDEPMSATAALHQLLRAVGVPGQRLPSDLQECAAMYRGLLDNKRMLIVLDNARSVSQVRPLIPGNGRCRVLITSRDSLANLAGDHDLRRISLSVLSHQETVALLGKMIGRDRLLIDPSSVERLGTLCDRLPLALRIAGARLAAKPHLTVQHLVARLGDERRRLDELSDGEDGVRTSFRLSYRGLSPAAARLYRLLGLLQAPDFAAWVGAALLNTDTMAAEWLFEELVDALLLEVAPEATDPPRYRFQDLLGIFARECAQAEEEPDASAASLNRAFTAWLAMADTAYRRLHGGEFAHALAAPPLDHPEWADESLIGDPMEWFEAERCAIVATIEQTAATDLATYASGLTVRMDPVFEARNYLEDWRTCAEQSLLATRRAGDRLGESAMLATIGALGIYRRRYDEAELHLRASLQLLTDTDPPHGRTAVLRNLALCARFQGDLDGALDFCTRAIEDYRAANDLGGAAHALGILAQIELERGNVERALELGNEAVAQSRAAGETRGEAQNSYRLALALIQHGDLTAATPVCERVVDLSMAIGDRVGVAYGLCTMGSVLWRQDRIDESRAVLTKAVAAAVDLADRFLRARAESELSYVLTLAGSPEAMSHLRIARDILAELGARPWLERAHRVLTEIGALRSAPTVDELVNIID